MTTQTEPQIAGRYALSSRVLAVAVERLDGWSCYIDAVPGKNHGTEQAEVARTGAKATEGIARALFPWLERTAYAR